MNVLDEKDLEQYGVKTARVYASLCRIFRTSPGILSLGRFPDPIDKIILCMAHDASDAAEFLANYDSQTDYLFQQLGGPHGYTVYKAWEAKYEAAGRTRSETTTS